MYAVREPPQAPARAALRLEWMAAWVAPRALSRLQPSLEPSLRDRRLQLGAHHQPPLGTICYQLMPPHSFILDCFVKAFSVDTARYSASTMWLPPEAQCLLSDHMQTSSSRLATGGSRLSPLSLASPDTRGQLLRVV